jgi:hypothetical protein
MRTVIFILFGLLVLAAAIVGTYRYTKDSYHAVGLNDGAIEARADLMKRLRQIATPVPFCSSEQLQRGKEVVSVKAEAIYAVAQGSATFSLCAAP